MRSFFLLIGLLYGLNVTHAAYILLPMGEGEQSDHLKAYGITYWVLSNDIEAYWLLNYRGGSFAFPHNPVFEKECKTNP